LYFRALLFPAADIDVPHLRAPLAPITRGQPAVVKSVRSIHSSLIPLALICLASCAGARVGFQSDGSYVLERSERDADCNRLYKSIWGRIEVLKGLPARAKVEQESAAPTASSLFGRLFGGPNKGLAAVEEYNRERAHVVALQRAMVEKKCVDVDLAGELASADADMARLRQN
jgi:hypothetical protein